MIQEVSFEVALDRLQGAVKKLESGELSLEDSLRCFEEGVALTKVCQNHLTVAEQRIEILTRTSSDNRIETEPFRP